MKSCKLCNRIFLTRPKTSSEKEAQNKYKWMVLKNKTNRCEDNANKKVLGCNFIRVNC